MSFFPNKTGVPWEYITSIHLDSISKSYNGTDAVRDLSLTIEGGELIALIGGSGSGKTTTLRMINRLVEPNSGTISINNIPTSTLDPLALRRSIGYVIQQIGLLPHLTVAANIGLPLKIEGWSDEKIQQRVRSLLSVVRLDPDAFQNRKPSELSGGQQQRVGLARALAKSPPLLLMDEPFGALDPLLSRELQTEFLEIKKNLGLTIIFVTHDIREAFLLADRIALLHEGRLHAVGTPFELTQAAAFDPLISFFFGDDRLPYIGATAVSHLALSAGSFLVREGSSMDEHTPVDPDLKVIIHRGEKDELIASFPNKETGDSSVVMLPQDTTIQQAVSACISVGSQVVGVQDTDNVAEKKISVILLEDMIQYLFGPSI